MDARRTIISRGAVAIKGHTIAAVGRQAQILRDWHATGTHRCRRRDRPSRLCRCAFARERADLPRILSRRRQQGWGARPELCRLESDADSRGRECRGGTRCRRDASARDHDVRRTRQRVRAGCGGRGDPAGRHPLHARRTLPLGHDRGHGSDPRARQQGLVRARAAGARPVPQIARQPTVSQRGQGWHHPRSRRALWRRIGFRRALCRRQGDRRSGGCDPQQSHRLRSRSRGRDGARLGQAAFRASGGAGRARAEHDVRSHEPDPRRRGRLDRQVQDCRSSGARSRMFRAARRSGSLLESRR